MAFQYIVFNISAPLFRIIKISAAVVRDLSVLKCQLQIRILQSFQIYTAHMENARCSLKYRRGKHLAHRNIYIRHTVFENCFFLIVIEMIQFHFEICPILSPAFHMNIFPLVKCIDHCLLYFLVELCIQCIDADHFIKDFRIFLSDLRHRIRHDGKAAFFPFDIFICQLPGPAVAADRQLLLFFIVGRSFRYRLR